MLRLTPVERIELDRGSQQTAAGLQDLLFIIDTRGRVDEPEVYQDERKGGSDFDSGVESGGDGSVFTRLSRRGSRRSSNGSKQSAKTGVRCHWAGPCVPLRCGCVGACGRLRHVLRWNALHWSPGDVEDYGC